MVSIIKNQILKHLEKFAKNLSVENINLSTFKGEGELNSLELNEIVLTDLLELPTWMKMTSATVNKVKFKIPFTKIKSVPIEFNLDNVQIEVETCESIRSMSMDSGLSAYSQPSAYNAIRKIVDGITVNINSVTLKFISPAFVASVHILRVKVQSKSPTWKAVPLKETLLKNKAKTQVLIFKELTWDSVRIEARSTMDKSLPPLRLLTNQARCRITIKKRLSDSYVLGSRLALSLDDLLWVLTDSQLTAALHFLDSLSGLVQQANELSRRIKAKRKLEELPEYHAQLAQQQHSNSTATSQQPEDTKSAFHKHDVMETSYHFLCKKFDIHLSDDPGAGRSIHPDLTGGGAWQITLVSLRFDFYPYHLASTNRQHWWRYTDSTPHYQWLSEAQESFKSKLAHVMDRLQNSPRRAAVNNSATANATAPNTPTSEAPGKLFSSPVKEPFIRQLSKLMTTCAVIQIGDFTLFKVTTNKEQTAREFIRGDVRRENVPGGDVLLHAEFTYYYYPGDIKFPLPSPKFYVQLNPIQIIFDLITLLWLNAFTLNLHKNLMSTQAVTQATSSSEDTNKLMYFDVKIEAIMMKLILGPPQRTIYRVVPTTGQAPGHCTGCVAYHTTPYQELLWTKAKDIWCIKLEPVWAEFHTSSDPSPHTAVPFLDNFPLTIWAHTRPSPGDSTPRTGQTRLADIHAVAYVSNLISVQLNHYQVLFLLRLAEDISELVTFLSMDAQKN
ncbi:LOW QUALITY PROTEIN: UHRF1-binding protein 1-like, partial [Diaphorina citri]|uniref:LOW QUALITY PROTEIN: UHRF1-binding protein 1-like n=1 Tax=Diaphorina citri TaxID=121845 RepID=A0A3Q0IVK8_DIACI